MRRRSDGQAVAGSGKEIVGNETGRNLRVGTDTKLINFWL